MKETFCQKRDDLDKEKLEQNNLSTSENDGKLIIG
jgi:hypothetical protein